MKSSRQKAAAAKIAILATLVLNLAFLSIACPTPVEPSCDADDRASVLSDAGALSIGFSGGDTAASVTRDLVLPEAGPSGTRIEWSSSKTESISSLGVVHRPPHGVGAAAVTLSASVSKGQASELRTFDLTVIPEPAPDAPNVTGLADFLEPARSATWSWGASVEACEFRFRIDSEPAAPAADSLEWSAWSSSASASIDSGDGWRYLHVQARNAGGTESEPATARALLDNTAPEIFVVTASEPSILARPTWSWPSSVERVAYRVSLDAGPVVEIGSATGWSPEADLEAGDHSLAVAARDSAGNWSQDCGALATVLATIEPWSSFVRASDSEGAFHALAPLDAGGIIAAGCLSAPTRGYDALASAIGADGVPLWAMGFGADGGGYDEFASVARVGDSYFLAGMTWSASSEPGSSTDALLARFDASGAFSWAKTYGGPGGNERFHASAAVEGGALLVGERRDASSECTEILVTRVDAAGTLLWSITLSSGYPTTPLRGYSAMEVSDGYLVGAEQNSSTGAARRSLIIKLSKADGSVIWQNRYSKLGTTTPAIQSLVAAPGSTFAYAAGSNEYEAIILPVYLSSGAMHTSIQGTVFNLGACQPYAYAHAALGSDGGLLITATKLGSPDSALWAASLSSAGALRWQALYGAGGSAIGRAALWGDDERIYLAGSAKDGTSAKANPWILSPESLDGSLAGIGATASIVKAALLSVSVDASSFARTDRSATTAVTTLDSTFGPHDLTIE